MTSAELELLNEARRLCSAMLDEKDAVGRNEFAHVLETFPHSRQDISFMLYDKTTRILGAERLSADRESIDDIRDNLIDIVNYALFGLMFILRDEP